MNTYKIKFELILNFFYAENPVFMELVEAETPRQAIDELQKRKSYSGVISISDISRIE